MAKTEEYYKALMDAYMEAEQSADLPDPSTSLTAIHNLVKDTVAYCHARQSELFDVLKGEIEAAIAQNLIPTPEWFFARCFEFQYGYLLSIVDNKPGYSATDTDAQIITRAAIVPVSGRVNIKVAKSETPEPLSTDELLAFKAYWDKVAPAGVQLVITSYEPDRIKVVGTVVYNAQIAADTVEEAILVSLEDYLASLPFDGKHENESGDDAVQATEGVESFALKYYAKDNTGTYTEVTREYSPLSGYFVFDRDNSALTMTPNV